MAVLTRDAILAEIEAGRLRIDPFAPSAVGPASIDLTLGDELRVIEPRPDPIPIKRGRRLPALHPAHRSRHPLRAEARGDGPRHHAASASPWQPG